jgi:hypothetical protein
MRVIDTSITIGAAPERIWDIITDFGKYPDWNPFIPEAKGQPVAGNKIEAFIRPPGEKGMTHTPTITIAEPGKHLQWLGKVAFPGVFSARHEFILSPVAEGTELRHREEFWGLLVPFFGKTLKRAEEGFVAFNNAVKERAEKDS